MSKQLRLKIIRNFRFRKSVAMGNLIRYVIHRLHLNRLKALMLRADYFYIPKVEYLEFSYKVDKEINIYLDAIVMETDDVQQVCHSMINQFIAIFSLDD